MAKNWEIGNFSTETGLSFMEFQEFLRFKSKISNRKKLKNR